MQAKTTEPADPKIKAHMHVVYCIPTLFNPSATIMIGARRKELVRVARKCDALFTCDDVYCTFYCYGNHRNVSVTKS